MDSWWKTARKSRKEEIKSLKITEITNVQRNVIEAIEGRRLRMFGNFKRMINNRIPKNDSGVEF